MDAATKRKVLRKVAADIADHEAEIKKLREFWVYVMGDEDQPAPAMSRAEPTIPSPSDQPLPTRPTVLRNYAGRPTLKQRVQLALGGLPHSVSLNVPEIEKMLVTTGWDNSSENSAHVLRRVLRELVADGFLVKDGTRHYALNRPSMFAPQPADAPGG